MLIPVLMLLVTQKWAWQRTEKKVRMLEKVRRTFRRMGRVLGLNGWPMTASEEDRSEREKPPQKNIVSA